MKNNHVSCPFQRFHKMDKTSLQNYLTEKVKFQILIVEL